MSVAATTGPLAVRATWTSRKLGSWHLVNTIYDARTFCGRRPGTTYLSEIPGDEKSCERCAVLATKRAVA